jgi:hypothetical protein
LVIGGDLEPVGLADRGDLGVGLAQVHSEGKEAGGAAQLSSEIAVLEALQVVLADHQALAVIGLRLRADAVKLHFANDGSMAGRASSRFDHERLRCIGDAWPGPADPRSWLQAHHPANWHGGKFQ